MLVTAVGQGARGAMRIRLGVEMLAAFDGASAPRTGGQLIRRTDPSPAVLISTQLLDRFGGVIGTVGCGATTDPQAERRADRQLRPGLRLARDGRVS